MSLAKKCDRCGKFYKHYPDGNKWQWNAIRKFKNQNIIETIRSEVR